MQPFSIIHNIYYPHFELLVDILTNENINQHRLILGKTLYIKSSLGRYCSASARWAWVIASDLAKSAMVRHPVIGPHRQLQLAHGGLHQRLSCVIQVTVLADLGWVNIGEERLPFTDVSMVKAIAHTR